MAALDWSARRLVIFLLCGIGLSVCLLVMGYLIGPRPLKFFWLVPYPMDSTTAWRILAQAFAARPLEVIALVVIPIVLGLTTLAWTVRKLAT